MIKTSVVLLLSIFILAGCQSEEDKIAIRETKQFILHSVDEPDLIKFRNMEAYTHLVFVDGRLKDKLLFICGERTHNLPKSKADAEYIRFVAMKPVIVDGRDHFIGYAQVFDTYYQSNEITEGMFKGHCTDEKIYQ